MIKKIFSVVALLFLMVSCTNVLDNGYSPQMRPGHTPVFYASIEGGDDAQTKVFADELMRVLWNADDRVTIFDKYTYGYEFYFDGEDGDNAGIFKQVPNSDFVSGNPLDHIYALYPHKTTTKISNDGEITTTLPDEQTYKAKSFGIGANTMLSVSEDSKLLFRNVGGYLSFKFYGNGVSVNSITLKGNNGEKLAGKAKITMSVNGTPTTVMQNDATETITLTCTTPVALEASASDYTEFWFVVPPTTFTQGFTVTVTDSQGGVFTKTTSANIEIKRNKLARMAAMEVIPTHTQTQPANEIWYTSINGQIVTPANSDNFGANILSNTYTDGKGVILFDGDVTKIGNREVSSSNEAPFYRCNTLSSISLPSSVRTICFVAFGNCNNLQEVILPETLDFCGLGAFSNTAIETFYMPETAVINGNPVENCSNLVKLKGPYASEDGRMLIKDHTVFSFAHSGLTTYTIPDGITGIGNQAFLGATLQSIVLPNSLSSIGIQAFTSSALTEIVLPENLTSIGGAAFAGCRSLTSITLPPLVKLLSVDIFEECVSMTSFAGKYASADGRLLVVDGVTYGFAPAGVVSYTVPDDVTTLLGGFYSYNNLPELHELSLPESLLSINLRAENLETLTVKAITPPSVDYGNIYYLYLPSIETIYVPAASVDAYKTAQYWSEYADHIQAIPGGQPNNEIWYTSTNGDIVTPFTSHPFNATVVSNTYANGKGIIRLDADLTVIDQAAFLGTKLQTISLPSSVETLGRQAFESTNLEHFNVPDNVSSIEESCFNNCSNLSSFSGKYASDDGRMLIVNNTVIAFAPHGLTEYTVPSDVKYIGGYSFWGAGLTSIVLSDGVEKIYQRAFEGCRNLTSISIPSSLTEIGNYVFMDCTSLESINIPGSIESLGDAFARCSSLESIEGPFATSDHLALIFNGELKAFAIGSNVKEFTIPSSVHRICNFAFTGASLDRLIIPEGITEIGWFGLNQCGVKELILPSSLTSVSMEAFAYNDLTAITFLSLTPPSPTHGNSTNILDNTNNCPIYVPSVSVNAYKTAVGWSNYAARIVPMGEAQEAVDMGLPSGTKWATFNVGAMSPEQPGLFFAWGETTPKASFSIDNYLYGAYPTMTKYCSTDGLTTLEAQDDAATAFLGGTWRMPTHEEQAELHNYCTFTQTTVNGITGYLVTSDMNGNSIFLPFVNDSNNDMSFYWSSSLWTNEDTQACSFGLSPLGASYTHGNYGSVRYKGHPIRPVCH